MKKKSVLINFTIIIAVLFAMLLQSVHSFEHISKLFSEKKCHHKYTGKTEISHQHHPFDHCFACEFTFSNGLPSEVFLTKIFRDFRVTPCSFASPEFIISYSKNPNFLRGPPSFIA